MFVTDLNTGPPQADRIMFLDPQYIHLRGEWPRTQQNTIWRA